MTYGVLSVSTTYYLPIGYDLFFRFLLFHSVCRLLEGRRVLFQHNVKPGEVSADEPAPGVPVRLQTVGGDAGPARPPAQPSPGVPVRLQAVDGEGGPARPPPPQLPRLQAPSHQPD
jgi:hypothetical protein